MEKLKVVAVHDAAGRIEGFVTSRPDTPTGSLVTAPGQAISEIDVPEAMLEGDEREALERLSGVLHRYQTEYRIERETSVRLVPKRESAQGELHPMRPRRDTEES